MADIVEQNPKNTSLIGVVLVKPLLHFFLDRPVGHSLLFAVGALAAA